MCMIIVGEGVGEQELIYCSCNGENFPLSNSLIRTAVHES